MRKNIDIRIALLIELLTLGAENVADNDNVLTVSEAIPLTKGI